MSLFAKEGVTVGFDSSEGEFAVERGAADSELPGGKGFQNTQNTSINTVPIKNPSRKQRILIVDEH